MKYFKTDTARCSERYRITPEIFEKVTKHKYPFEVRNSDGTISQYGVCPSCLNPIQLVGMVKTTKRTPYGKHTGKTINGIANWQQLKYEYCPYATHNCHQEINDNDLLPEITEDIIELYDLLKNNFDIVVYIIQKELDIKCSLNFWNKVLQQYLVNQAYCFPYLTEVNLPYVFAYRGMTHNSLYGQQVRVNSEIFFALQKHRYVKFNTPKVQDKEYRIIASQNNFLNLEFRFTEYTQHAVDGNELVESMEFCVDDLSDGKTVFCKTIEFSETYFMNIVNHTNKDYRNQKLLDIAKTTMLPLNK